VPWWVARRGALARGQGPGAERAPAWRCETHKAAYGPPSPSGPPCAALPQASCLITQLRGPDNLAYLILNTVMGIAPLLVAIAAQHTLVAAFRRKLRAEVVAIKTEAAQPGGGGGGGGGGGSGGAGGAEDAV
jgi:uncharacterized membrane protein YgcG